MSAVRPAASPLGGPSPRRLGRLHWRGLLTLYLREVDRFRRSALEGIGGMMVSNGLFLAVFSVALPADAARSLGLTPLQFLLPGLATYAVLLTAFEYAAFPILFDKLEGMIADLLMSPLSPLETLCGYVAAAVTCSLLVGAVLLVPLGFIVDLPFPDPGRALLVAALGALLFALLGFLTGLWASKWDRYALVETFVVLPLGLLSGTVFTLDALPPTAQAIALGNPVFYVIDGVRHGVAGIGDTGLATAVALLLVLDAVLFLFAWRLLARGWRIKP